VRPTPEFVAARDKFVSTVYRMSIVTGDVSPVVLEETADSPMQADPDNVTESTAIGS